MHKRLTACYLAATPKELIMNTQRIINNLRECRDYIKGRSFGSEKGEFTFADIRCQIRNSYPPFRGERVRRSALGFIGMLVTFATCYCFLAG